MSDKIKGYWFSRADGKLGYNDGRVAAVGIKHTVEGEIIPCEHGLHFSPTILDALQYAPGARLWLVEGSGTVVAHGNPVDKYAASNRLYLADYGDVLPILVKFAQWCAKRAAKYAKCAKCAKYAAKCAKYAQSAAKCAKYAQSAAKCAKYAAKCAEYAEYAAKCAEYAAEERIAQENWLQHIVKGAK